MKRVVSLQMKVTALERLNTEVELGMDWLDNFEGGEKSRRILYLD